MERRKCEHPGCPKLGRNKGFYKGQTRYDRFCEVHHRARYGGEKSYYREKQLIPNEVCVSCGWDKAPCDRHRRVRALGYTTENVLILCPNCHRLAHLGLLTEIVNAPTEVVAH